MKKKKKETGRSHSSATANGRVVLVGTYRGDQLTKWRGWYNYPMGDGDGLAAKDAKAGLTQSPQRESESKGNLCASASLRETETSRTSCEKIPDWLPLVNELWLFRSTAAQRNYRAEFVGIKTRDELIRDYGYPGDDLPRAETQRRGDGRGKRPVCPKPHGTHYALFKTEFLYPHEGGAPEEADAVIVRVGDFAKRSPKIAKQLKAYLESPDRRAPDLAKRLPRILTRLRPEQLRVCEEAVQLSFWDLPQMKGAMQSLIPFPRKENPSFTFIDLFAGVGGIRMGFQDAGGECVFSSEWNTEAARTYQMNFGEYPQGDITKISTLPRTVLRDFLDESGDFEFLQPCEYTLIHHPRRQEDSGLIFAGYRNKSIRKVGVRPNTLHLSRVHKQPNRIYSVDGIHPTLPSQESSGRYFILTHENTVRKLTIDECWRIMGFPSQFVRPSTIGEQYRQLGNSVCVPMIRTVAREVVHQLLEGRNEKETRCNS